MMLANLNLLRASGDIDVTLYSQLWEAALSSGLAVDAETTGLDPLCDSLEVVSLAVPDCVVVVDIHDEVPHNVSRLLSDASIVKIFHNALFDTSFFRARWGLAVNSVFCTKVAARLASVERNPHLASLVETLLGERLDKTEQRSDWTRRPLSEQQVRYAANDVLFLHDLRRVLERKLNDVGRLTIHERCMQFLPLRVELGLLDLGDVFAYELGEPRALNSDRPLFY